MRVTKDIREYVERIIREDAYRKADALERPADNEKKVEEYTKWAIERLKEIDRVLAKEASAKLIELGLDVRPVQRYDKRAYESYIRDMGLSETPENHLLYLISKRHISISDANNLVSNPEMDKYNKQHDDLMNNWRNKAQEILVGLEIGDINKKELDTVLAPYKE